MRNDARSGFVFLDILTGLTMLAAVAFALATALSANSRAAKRFGDERAAVSLAERTLIELQCRRPVPHDSPDGQVEVVPLAAPAGVTGSSWVRVRAVVGGRSATLVGRAAPPATLPAEAQP